MLGVGYLCYVLYLIVSFNPHNSALKNTELSLFIHMRKSRSREAKPLRYGHTASS